jgi:hypothetical protein
MAVLDLLASLIMRLPFERRLLYSFWAVLFATFVASIVTTFSSCASIRLYWQIDPDPGNWYDTLLVQPIFKLKLTWSASLAQHGYTRTNSAI